MCYFHLLSKVTNKFISTIITISLLISSSFVVASSPFSVQTSRVNLFTGPGLNYPVVEQLKQGDNLELLAVETEFVQVKVLQTGIIGWLKSSDQGWSFESSDALKKLKKTKVKQQSINASSTDAMYLGSDFAYTNLDELGMTDGHTFEGNQAQGTQDFWFPIPRSMKVNKGELWLHYLASSTLTENSLVRIDINGKPRLTKAISLSGTDTWIRVPLKGDDFNSSEDLRLTIQPSLLGLGSRCSGELLAANFLHILPDTAVTMQLPNKANSVERAIELLHKKVSLSVPQYMTPAQYNNALELTVNLLKQGKEVTFVQFPIWGDIMVVNKQDMQMLIHETYHSTVELQKTFGLPREYLNKEQNINYLKLPDRSPIVISDTFEELPASLISWQWPRIAKQLGYRVNSAHTLGDKVYVQEQSIIPLKNLGLDMATRFARPKVDWQMVITPDQLPPNSELDKLQMSVITAPSDPAVPPLFYVYLNNVLQQAIRLRTDGMPTKFTVFLGKSEQQEGMNYIRFVTQRTSVSGDCSGSLNEFPVQISPESVLIIDENINELEQFKELPSYFSSGFDLFLPKAILKKSSMESLSFLGNLFIENNYNYAHKRLKFYTEQHQLNFDKPFILMGNKDVGLNDIAVKLDKGNIQVKDFKDNLLLDIEDLGNITIFQLVQASDKYGLLITPPEQQTYPLGKPIQLVNDDVGFADSRGMLLTLNSKQTKVSSVGYPEYKNWFDIFSEYRFLIMALGWLLITLLVVHLYNKAADHKKLKKSDEESV